MRANSPSWAGTRHNTYCILASNKDNDTTMEPPKTNQQITNTAEEKQARDTINAPRDVFI